MRVPVTRTVRLRGRRAFPVLGALLAIVLAAGSVAAAAQGSARVEPLASGRDLAPGGSAVDDGSGSSGGAPSSASAAAPAGGAAAAPSAVPVRAPVAVQVHPPVAVATPARRAPVRPAPSAAPAARYLSAAWGVDVSFPQCGPLGMPRTQAGFAVVGLNNGSPFTGNPCAAQELQFARGTTGLAVYVNTAAPASGDPAAYGRRLAEDTLGRLAALGLRVPTVWLDVETLNHWADPATNVAVLSSAMRTFAAHGQGYGVYSAPLMWQRITGGIDPQAPVWIATAVRDYHRVQDSCAEGIGGRRAVMGQYVAWDGRQAVDVNMLCTSALPASVTMFAPGLRRR